MKIALYIEDGLEQIVLTPETETERGIIGKLTDDNRELSIRKGSFYHCQGGWTRQGASGWTHSRTYGSSADSTMIVLWPKTVAPPAPDTTPTSYGDGA